jgi:putative flavoprotein involved in K+ transport
MSNPERVGTVVIGAGQAGLSTGYHLARRGLPFVILEAAPRVGDVWRNRFDSLRLYSPAGYDALPGMGMPLGRWDYPGKHDMADYLESYAAAFDLPVRTNSPVDGLAKVGGTFIVRSGARTIEADNVVVASGGWQTPWIPDFAEKLDPGIQQLHSDDYRNPAQITGRRVLVVGSSHSGADIALDLAATHEVVLSGPVRGEAPFDIEGRTARTLIPVLWFVANHVLTERTPIGRKMRHHVRHEGAPLLRVKRAHLEAAGVERTEEKTVGVRAGLPLLAGGGSVEVDAIVWCTGFRKDTSWIDLSVQGEDGWPVQRQGAAQDHPGLFFVGLPFQFAFGSMLVGGVGRDAKWVAKQVARRTSSTTHDVEENIAVAG